MRSTLLCASLAAGLCLALLAMAPHAAQAQYDNGHACGTNDSCISNNCVSGTCQQKAPEMPAILLPGFMLIAAGVVRRQRRKAERRDKAA